MNKDLRKVVIMLAHPNMKGAQANKALIEAVGDIEGVAVFNLYELSPDIAFNVDEWSKIISDVSAVISATFAPKVSAVSSMIFSNIFVFSCSLYYLNL